MKRPVVLLATALVAVIAVAPAPAGAGTGVSKVARDAAALTSCAWPVQSTPAKANVFYPDANATYWTMPFAVGRGLTVTIAGAFPNARYFSVQVYNALAQNYTAPVYGTSAISDYQLTPDGGAVNPWQTAVAAGTTAGTYTVTVSDTAPAGTANLLPLPPTVRSGISGIDATVGFLMLRVYLPDGSDDDPAVVPLPPVTFSGPTGRAVTLQPCASAQTAPSAQSQIKKAAVKQALNKALAGTDAAPAAPVCTKKQAGCAPSLQFFKAGLSATPFPNASSKYVAALYTRNAAYATVVKATMPTSATAAGDSPAVWNPTGPTQLRYWSICSYLHQPPYPVIRAASVNGCLADEQLAAGASGGTAYAVLTVPSKRPTSTVTSAKQPQVGWLPVSTASTSAAGLVAVRNMLPSAALPYALGPTPTTDPAAAQTAMGAYYPQIAQCLLTTFNSAAAAAGGGQTGAVAGVNACFANPASPPS